MTHTHAGRNRITSEALSAVVAGLLAGVALVFGLVLAFIGLPFWVGVSDGGSEPYRFAQTSGAGFIFALGGAIVLIGLARSNRLAAWVGAVIIAGYAGLGIFGVGAILIPLALLLILALLMWEFTRR